MLSKSAKFSTIFNILKLGKAIYDFIDWRYLFSFVDVPNFPNKHWLENRAWQMEKCIAMDEIDDLKEIVKCVKFIFLYIDKVIIVYNTSWVGIQVYIIENHLYQSHLLRV